MKTCKKCLEQKEITSFDKISVNGYRGTCRTCRNKKNRGSWLSKPQNVDSNREYMRLYFKKRYETLPEHRSYVSALCKIKSLLKKDIMFRQHIEELFTKEMSWDNYGTYWEIDHILPALKMFKMGYTMEEVNDWKNLRPLSITENRKKS